MLRPQFVGESAAKDFRREVAAFCAAERALSDDPGVREGEDGGGDVLAAGFAADGEVAEPGGGGGEHRSIIGEYKAKICTGAALILAGLIEAVMKPIAQSGLIAVATSDLSASLSRTRTPCRSMRALACSRQPKTTRRRTARHRPPSETKTFRGPMI